ncbi:MAG TPA: hypothetical protein VGK93_07835 [Candidatus Eisenbacteria bacterium]|jgi:hypothetical protein
MECFARASAAAPDRTEGWTATAALALLRGRPREALEAALQARRADPDGAEPLLMLGSALYRLSVLAYSDSAFRAARERLPAELSRRFDGDLLLGVEREAGDGSSAGVGIEDAAWQGSDPDLTTTENEARLDYLTRLSLAWFLFRRGSEVRWDQRAELFVRYGPPAAIEYNSAEAQLGGKELEFQYPRHSRVWYAPDPIPYPYNMQIWRYPDLGLEVALWDRSLSQSYALPYSFDRALDPLPDPTLVGARDDLVALAGGRGVFRAMAPGTHPMSVAGMASQFPTSNGVRLLAHVWAKGEPTDSLSGSWALVDSQSRVVRRESRALSISACDPTERQVAGFAETVPSGDYRLDLAVGGSGGRRGVAHLRVHVDPVPAGLSMSDVVLVCGDRSVAVGSEAVPIEPSRDAYLSRATTVIVYYELEGLATGQAGVGRFVYTYSIRRAEARGRGVDPSPLFEATREEENVGTHRRQFVGVPVASLSAGRYELRIVVRDLLGGESVENAARFVKDQRGIRVDPS